MLAGHAGGVAAGGGSGPSDSPQVDTSEQIYISSLALLKMLKHGDAPLQRRGNTAMRAIELAITIRRLR